ncbi:MAG: hypothetical protein IJW37_10120 [Lachnospiraceae bacterium]|nr:hypothetical protein [Lachnospiraceae bacterium]
MYGVDASKKTSKLKKSYFVNASKKTEKLKKCYVVGADKKLVKLWSGGELSYYGTADALSSARAYPTGATVGNYALFAGGWASSNIVDVYDKSLTKSIADNLYVGRYSSASASIGDYALFAGGKYTSGGTDYKTTTVNAYDSSLTRTTIDPFAYLSGSPICGASVGNNAIFGLGTDTYGSQSTYVEIYDESLTHSYSSILKGSAATQGAAVTIGDYALFASAGMSTPNGNMYSMQAINNQLTYCEVSSLSTPRYMSAAATVGDYAIFAGGYKTSSSNAVDIYDKGLTKISTSATLSTARREVAGASLGDYALFAGGFSVSAVVDVFDASLTKTTTTSLSEARYGMGVATVGDYAIFAGGRNGNSTAYNSAVVDVYQLS